MSCSTISNLLKAIVIFNYVSDNKLLHSICNWRKFQRSLCQASVYFAWNTETGQHRIIDFDLPIEIVGYISHNVDSNSRYRFEILSLLFQFFGAIVSNCRILQGILSNFFSFWNFNRGNWHPARDVSRRLRKELMTPSKPLYTLTNLPALTGLLILSYSTVVYSIVFIGFLNTK